MNSIAAIMEKLFPNVFLCSTGSWACWPYKKLRCWGRGKISSRKVRILLNLHGIYLWLSCLRSSFFLFFFSPRFGHQHSFLFPLSLFFGRIFTRNINSWFLLLPTLYVLFLESVVVLIIIFVTISFWNWHDDYDVVQVINRCLYEVWKVFS